MAARRRVCIENPEGRHMEQQQDMAARQRIHMENPERRQMEKLQDTEACRVSLQHTAIRREE